MNDTTDRLSKSKTTVKKIESARAPFAPVPRQLATDPRCSAEAVRLWAVLDGMAYERLSPDIKIIKARMATERKSRGGVIERREPSQASIYRWAGELAEAKWLEWDKNGDQSDRWKLKDGARETEDAHTMHRIRTAITAKRPAAEMVATIVEILNDEKTFRTVESEILTDEKTSLNAANKIPNAANKIPTGENLSIYRDSKKRSKTATDNPPTHPVDDEALRTYAFLRGQGVSEQKSRQFGSLPLTAVEREFFAFVTTTDGGERQQQIGKLLHRWEGAPPTGVPQARAADATGPINPAHYTGGQWDGLFVSGGASDEGQ